MQKRVSGVSVNGTAFKIMTNTSLRPAAVKCIKSIFYNFFFRQYRAALFPGKIPVSQVDHALDKKIPFTPDWIGIYLDFVAFWIRSIGFLLQEYREKVRGTVEQGAAAQGEQIPAQEKWITAVAAVKDFLDSMGALYAFAAEVYQKNLSTTMRPFYIRRFRFLLVHAFDPHLMCIPSLHVMVVIRTYTKFAAILRSLGDEKTYAPQIAEIKKGALDITEAILYVKQHSVNCVAAAMYAMTCFDAKLFPQSEAEDFVSRLFTEDTSDEPPVTAKLSKIGPAEGAEIRNHIATLYRQFLAEHCETSNKASPGTPGEVSSGAASWDTPLIRFLQSLPQKSARPETSAGAKS
ncbi:hypothetical protein EZS27_015674 [termite gut metagenome]|uniref:Uncharacterized protein n=1 Tax=termite gut metagenome TaxID=433724 RepID=A0A5J4RR02_9ZZZZ